MLRILHVHRAQPDYQTSQSLALLRARLGDQFTQAARTIGPGGDFRGLFSAAWRLRREAGRCDIVHCWGTTALAAAALGPWARILFTPDEFPTRRQLRWIWATAQHRTIDMLCPTATMQRAFLAAGLPPQRCHLVRPGVDFSAIRRRKDPELRRALGLAPDDHVLLAVGESTRGANHPQAIWAAAILNVLDARHRLLIWGRGPLAPQVRRFAGNIENGNSVIVAEQRLNRPIAFEHLPAAADMILVSATGPVSTLPIAVGMAAALPIVATVTPTVAELLEDRHTALMTQSGVPRLLAQRVLQMRQDPSAQWSLSDMARTEAYEFFSVTRFLEQHRAAYEQAAGTAPLTIPQPKAGAGLRFHGRA